MTDDNGNEQHDRTETTDSTPEPSGIWTFFKALGLIVLVLVVGVFVLGGLILATCFLGSS